MEKEKWYAYRDAPLYIAGAQRQPAGADVAAGVGRGRRRRRTASARGGRGGRGGDGPVGGGPKPEDISRASSSFKTTSCSVKTDGARIEVTFNGLSMGIFSGNLQFTAYRGTNLLRMDAIATTNEPSVAYKYDAGFTGFSTAKLSRLAWNDVGGSPQQYQFGGLKNEKPRAGQGGQPRDRCRRTWRVLAAFPMPHSFFWPRQVEVNLGYLWYRKDSDTTFSMGIRQAEQEGLSSTSRRSSSSTLRRGPCSTWARISTPARSPPRPRVRRC